MKVVMKCLFAALCLFINAASADWPTYAGDPQRTSWARGESILNRGNVGNLELKWRIQLNDVPKELTSLTAPVISDQIRTARGLKEFVIVGGSSDNLYAVDADTGKLVWQKSFGVTGTPALARDDGLCPFALNATPVVQPGRTRTVFTITSDGKLHALNIVDGEDRFPPTQFVPAFSKNWSLNLFKNVLYTALSQRCNGALSGVYSFDLNVPEHTINSFQAGRPGIWGRAGVAISVSGAVFAETGDGTYNPAGGSYADTFLALSPKELKLTDYYTPANREWITRKDLDMGNISPVVFKVKDKEFLVGAGKEGRLFMLDTGSLGGVTHREPFLRTELLTNENANHAGQGFWGAFATWEDTKGTRWLYAPAWGPPHPSAVPAFPVSNGSAAHGSIMAFRIDVKNDGLPQLSPAWISRDLNVPEPPIIANGVVFALSSGEDVQQIDIAGNPRITADRLRGSGKAVLYAFDSETGKELFSSGDLSSHTHFGGLAISNGRVFVTTYDGYLYAFGLKDENH